MMSSPAYKVNSKGIELFYIASLLSLAFDFSGPSQEGSKVQVLFYVSFLLFSFITIFYAMSKRVRVRVPFLLSFLGIVFVFVGVSVGLYNAQDTYAVLSKGVPATIYIVAAISTSIVFSVADIERLTKNIKIICLIYMIWSCVLEIAARGGLDLATSRYGILSGAYIAALGVFALGFAGRFRTIDIAISSFVLVVVGISVTRTVIPILLIQVLIAYILIPKANSFSRMGMALLIALLPLGLFAIDVGAELGLTDRWISRLTVSQRAGGDPSGLARLAETRYMIENFASSPETVLFGNGLAAKISLIGPEARRLEQILGPWSVSGQGSGFGHNNHVSLVFVAGILAGAPLLLLQFGHGIQGFRTGFRLRNRTSPSDEPLRYAVVWGGLIVVGTLIYGFLAPTFLHRDLCLWYGIGTGLVCWSRGVVTKERQDSA